MPIPQMSVPTAYDESPGYNRALESYNKIRFSQLLGGASPMTGHWPDTEPASNGGRRFTDGASVDGMYKQVMMGSSKTEPPTLWSLSSGPYRLSIPLRNGTVRSVELRADGQYPYAYKDAPYEPHPDPRAEEFMRHGSPRLPGGMNQELLNSPYSSYETPQPQFMPQPLPQPLPQKVPFRGPVAPNAIRVGDMIGPPQQAGPQPDTSMNYLPYGGRF